MRFAFHPHAESHVETDEQIRRFLASTDPELVGLCLDTGHVAYAHGNAPKLLHEEVGFTGQRIAERVEAAVAEQSHARL